MDKQELLGSIKSRIDTWHKIGQEANVECIKANATIKILQDVFAEIEDTKEEEELGISPILRMMHVYCDLFNEKCKNCFFSIDKNKCAMKLIENRVKELSESGAVKNEKRKN